MSPPSSTSRAKGDSGEMRDHIATLKKELADLMIAQRKVETEREGMEAQRDSLLNQLTDYGSRMAAIQESVNTIVAELKTHTRDRKTEESAIDGFTKERAELADEVERLKKIEEGAQSRRDTLAQELAGTQEKATQAREEMAQTQEEIAGIINILQVLTENISFTVEEIQGSIQYANKEALEDASQEFRKYVSDISEMLGTIEQVGLADLNDFISNVKLFIENADESVNYLMTRIQDNADNAVHSSADEFNGFMQDLVEIINNTRLTLKKLEISDLGGVYDIVSSIQADLDKQVATLMEAQAGLAAKETFLAFIDKEIARRKKIFDDLTTKLKNLLQKNKSKKDLIETLQKNSEGATQQKEKLDAALVQLKTDIKTRQDRIKEIVDEVGQIQDSLFDLKVAKITPKMVPIQDEEETSPAPVATPESPSPIATSLIKKGPKPEIAGSAKKKPAEPLEEVPESLIPEEPVETPIEVVVEPEVEIPPKSIAKKATKKVGKVSTTQADLEIGEATMEVPPAKATKKLPKFPIEVAPKKAAKGASKKAAKKSAKKAGKKAAKKGR